VIRDKIRWSAGYESGAEDSKKCADGDTVNEKNTRREH